jgi:hypothetical protein
MQAVIDILNGARIQFVDTMRTHYMPVGILGGATGGWAVWLDQISTVAGKVGAIVGCVLAIWALAEKVRSKIRERRESRKE